MANVVSHKWHNQYWLSFEVHEISKTTRKPDHDQYEQFRRDFLPPYRPSTLFVVENHTEVVT